MQMVIVAGCVFLLVELFFVTTPASYVESRKIWWAKLILSHNLTLVPTKPKSYPFLT